jgi:hypothetical protein
MKHIKKFESFETLNLTDKLNEEIFPGAGAAYIFVLLSIWIGKKIPRLSNNPFKSLSRFFKISKVIKKYKPLIEELDERFKNDETVQRQYRKIKKLGAGTFDQTEPATEADILKEYILRNVPQKMKSQVEDLFREIVAEVKEIGYDVYGED